MAKFHLGRRAKMYWGVAAAELSAMTELAIVRDVTASGIEREEIDVSCRENEEFRANAPGYAKVPLEFDLLYRPTDTGYLALESAAYDGTTVELAVLDQGKAVTGAKGSKGTYSIIKFSAPQPMDGAIIVSVVASLADGDSFTKVTVSGS